MNGRLRIQQNAHPAERLRGKVCGDHGDAEGPCGVLVDHQCEFARLLDGEIAGPGTFQHFRGIDAGSAHTVGRVVA
jgi:hypothetical protein